jgi:hypothetical protein
MGFLPDAETLGLEPADFRLQESEHDGPDSDACQCDRCRHRRLAAMQCQCDDCRDLRANPVRQRVSLQRYVAGALLALAAVVVMPRPGAALPFDLEHLTLEAGVAPPHNELVFDGKVARYELGAAATLRLTRLLSVEAEGQLLGLQGWRPSDVVGSGLAGWPGSDWGIEAMGREWAARLVVRTWGDVDLFGEYGRRDVPAPDGRYWAWIKLRWRVK